MMFTYSNTHKKKAFQPRRPDLHSNTVAGAAAAKAETDKAKTYTGTYSPVTSNLQQLRLKPLAAWALI
eukprot:16175-Heterococcus_DN1.PRE.2